MPDLSLILSSLMGLYEWAFIIRSRIMGLQFLYRGWNPIRYAGIISSSTSEPFSQTTRAFDKLLVTQKRQNKKKMDCSCFISNTTSLTSTSTPRLRLPKFTNPPSSGYSSNTFDCFLSIPTQSSVTTTNQIIIIIIPNSNPNTTTRPHPPNSPRPYFIITSTPTIPWRFESGSPRHSSSPCTEEVLGPIALRWNKSFPNNTAMGNGGSIQGSLGPRKAVQWWRGSSARRNRRFRMSPPTRTTWFCLPMQFSQANRTWHCQCLAASFEFKASATSLPAKRDCFAKSLGVSCLRSQFSVTRIFSDRILAWNSWSLKWRRTNARILLLQTEASKGSEGYCRENKGEI